MPGELLYDCTESHEMICRQRIRFFAMAKSTPAREHKPSEVELVPDAWPRFERFIRDIAKAGPQIGSPSLKADRERVPPVGQRKIPESTQNRLSSDGA
jgi:hypothetical protein